jgi:hypothetical protein
MLVLSKEPLARSVTELDTILLFPRRTRCATAHDGASQPLRNQHSAYILSARSEHPARAAVVAARCSLRSLCGKRTRLAQDRDHHRRRAVEAEMSRGCQAGAQMNTGWGQRIFVHSLNFFDSRDMHCAEKVGTMAQTLRLNLPAHAIGRVLALAVIMTGTVLLIDRAAALDSECKALLRDKIRAANAYDHKQIIKTTRALLEFCKHELVAMESYASHVSDLALALWQDGQANEGCCCRAMPAAQDGRLPKLFSCEGWSAVWSETLRGGEADS